MSVPIVYSSKDVGAPSFIPSDTSTWRALIKQCLVYGYSSKAAAGWTLAYEDNVAGTTVLQQGTGNKRFLWMGNAGLSNYNNYQANRSLQTKSYNYMTDINTGTGMWPPQGVYNSWSLASSYDTATTTPLDWVIVATSNFVLVYTFMVQAWSPPNYISKTAYIFGDFKSTVAGDTYNTILTGYEAALGAGYNYPISNDPTDVFPFTYSVNKSAGTSAYIWLAGPYYQQAGTPIVGRLITDNLAQTGAYQGAGVNNFPDFCTNGLFLSNIQVQEFWNGTSSVRGNLPGFYAPCFDPTHSNGTIVTGTGDLAGKSFLVVQNPNTNFQYSVPLYILLNDWGI